MKQSKSTNLKQFNPLQYLLHRNLGSVMLLNSDNHAGNSFGGTYGLFVLLLNMYFLLQFTPSVLLSSFLGKS